MQTRLSIDLGDASLVGLVRMEAHDTDSTVREVCIRALESYLASKLETKAAESGPPNPPEPPHEPQ